MPALLSHCGHSVIAEYRVREPMRHAVQQHQQRNYSRVTVDGGDCVEPGQRGSASRKLSVPPADLLLRSAAVSITHSWARCMRWQRSVQLHSWNVLVQRASQREQ